MTVGTQMQKAIIGIQSAASTMKTFALETEDKAAKKDFKNIAQDIDNALKVLENGQKYIGQQEPTYKSQ